jgi:hypothetical protein
MAKDIPRAVPQPVLEPAAHDIALPAPRPPLDPAAHDIARPAPRPLLEPAAHDIARHAPRPASRPAHGARAGWILSTVVAAGAAWAVGWVAGVSWAWREMTPRYLRRTHRRRGASLPGAGSPLRS